MCATRLHNFCINEQLAAGISDPLIQQQQQMLQLGEGGGSSPGSLLPGGVPVGPAVSSVRGNSLMRDIDVVDHIQSMALSRPLHNIRRNTDNKS
jgi:hypothetical protein